MSQTDSLQKIEKPFTVVEVKPEFPGGEKARQQFIAKQIKYPKDTVGCQPVFTIYVTFVIEKDGSISSAKILANKGGNASFEEESIRVVNAMPNWSPGTQNGNKVRVQFNLPIRYYLKEEDAVHTLVDKAPKFPGGDKAMKKFIKKNCNYPPNALKEGRKGVYYVQVVVEKDGKLSDCKIIQQGKGPHDLEEEALRVVKDMPKWEPAVRKNKIVRASISIPVEFK